MLINFVSHKYFWVKSAKTDFCFSHAFALAGNLPTSARAIGAIVSTVAGFPADKVPLHIEFVEIRVNLTSDPADYVT